MAPDPVDVRLLNAVAEMGRAAVHDVAARLGMDVREVAARLAALSTTGLPLVVGVECDQQGIRHALAAANAWLSQHSGGHQVYGPPSGGYSVYGPPSGGYPAPHSGGYPVPPGPARGGPSGPQPNSGPQPQPGPPGPVPPPGPPAQQRPDPMNTWGPPGSAAWARGDQQSAPASPSTGAVGSKLDGVGPDGEPVTIHLVEVVDPADFLFTAAGYQLQPGERSVVVHTELTNRGSVPFGSVPDLSLLLVTADGSTISKAPVSLSSRPPHRTGVPPGETVGGHTVYVLSEATELVSVRWAPRPGDQQHTLSWDIADS